MAKTFREGWTAEMVAWMVAHRPLGMTEQEAINHFTGEAV